MKRFKNIAVLIFENSDFVGEALNLTVEQEIDTTDIVINGDKVVKNRINSTWWSQRNNYSTANYLKTAQSVLVSLFEASNELDSSEIKSVLKAINGFLSDALGSIDGSINKQENEDSEMSADLAEVCDAVSGAMICINRIRITASIYSDASFTDEDSEDENYIIF